MQNNNELSNISKNEFALKNIKVFDVEKVKKLIPDTNKGD